LLIDQRLAEFEELLTDPDYFKDFMSKIKDQKLGDIVDIIKSLSKDFKNLLTIVLSLKRLLKANSTISVSLILTEALETIIAETCKILNCDRVNIFIIDFSL